jgi:hypoxanthine phosphoribosyltransferase
MKVLAGAQSEKPSSPIMDAIPEVLLSAATLAERVQALGATITQDYRGRSLVLLCVLKGSFMFAADLARAIDLPLRIEFLGVRSYGDDTRSSGVVQITQDITRPIAGDDVLLVEDIVDTGLTLSYLKEQLMARAPASVKVCALLHKPSRSVRPVDIDFLGFTVEDHFVVGYGLDYAERYRNLPYVGILAAS